MMLKRPTPETELNAVPARLIQAGRAGLAAVTACAGLATGCLDRPVVPATPTTSNVFVDQIVQTAVDKIDLLFMIDNSASMADKQQILAAAVPVLLSRLVSPICVDSNGAPVGGTTDATGACATGSPEFSPINDIHIGIVTSSLGARGGSVCAAPAPGDTNSHLDDQGHLLGTERSGLVSWNGSGFLAWDPSGLKDVPPGENNAGNLNTDFTAMVSAAGEDGCGFEAQLEGWYRFLIDPEPPTSVTKVNNLSVRQGMDTTLLAQRAAFLRPDSLVAVVMLTDENDCSIQESGVGWFVGSTSHMPKATAACAQNPNDPCCRSCAQNETSPPPGCMALSADPVCMGAPAGLYNTWDTLHDSLNMRCYNQKGRFGFDLLYPTQRYVTGLTSPTLVLQSDGKTVVTNPLYDTQGSGKAPRDPSLVFLAGIIGVPWQDIATPDSLTSPTALTYLTATELAAPDANGKTRWDQLLGNPTASPPVPPSDPFMVETIDPTARSGPNPNVPTESIMPDTSMNPQANHINGHEQNTSSDMGDLQFACTFALASPKQCMAGSPACDCAAAADGTTTLLTAYNNPICQPPGGGPVGTTQYYAKAYPGHRELQVLKDFGANAIVASICPKVQSPSTDPNFGYNPAVGAIIERLKEALKGKCLPRALQHTVANDKSSPVECEVVEAQKAGMCDCTQPGRSTADPSIYSAVFSQLQASGTCGNNAGQTKCDTTGFCMCQINQETGSDLAACQADSSTNTAGYCYIDDPTSPALKNCPDNQKRLLRFVDSGTTKTPAEGAVAFIACLGAAINSDGG